MLDNPDKGQVEITGQTPGSTATYTCNDGFKLVGDESRECLYDGRWNGSEPTCTREALMHMILCMCMSLLLPPHNALVDVAFEK